MRNVGKVPTAFVNSYDSFVWKKSDKLMLSD
jgi:hypothetical protein